MKPRMIVAAVALAAATAAHAQPDPLPSWNDGRAKRAIVELVRATTDKSSPSYVRPEERIATFDQDGTLWVEHPLYTQAMFALDRIHVLAPQHPEWKTLPPFNAILNNDKQAIAKLGESDWEQIVGARHAGMSTEEFLALVEDWLAKAKHPRWVFHDDAEREYAYGPAGGEPDTKVGTFSQALMDEAKKNGWIVASMKDDWKRIFSFKEVAGR